MLEFLRLPGHFDCELFDVKSQLFDLGLVSTTILLKGEVILLLLSGSEGPLFELLLVPVHLELELVHLLICLEDHVLDVVQSVLLVSHALLKLLNFVLEPATLPLSNLLEMFFTLNFLVFHIH